MFPPGNGIYYLRTASEALALKAHFDRSKSLIVIGGGLIGLEVASSAAEIGIATTVIEIAPAFLRASAMRTPPLSCTGAIVSTASTSGLPRRRSPCIVERRPVRGRNPIGRNARS